MRTHAAAPPSRLVSLSLFTLTWLVMLPAIMSEVATPNTNAPPKPAIAPYLTHLRLPFVSPLPLFTITSILAAKWLLGLPSPGNRHITPIIRYLIIIPPPRHLAISDRPTRHNL